MEFNEKLQQLRKENDLTQEQLARKLYVSRTAISKWESGKGYPSIESLKCISEFFSISIDQLLSGEELIGLAEKENRSNVSKIYSYIRGILDILALAFIFLPLYGQADGDYIRSVTLLNYTEAGAVILALNWLILILLVILGVCQLISKRLGKSKICNIGARIAFGLDIFAICFFIATRQPYVATLMFLLFMVKVMILVKDKKMK